MEGINGLYRGFSVSVLGTIPYAGVGYFSYETLKRFHKETTSETPNPFFRLIYGAMAGIAGQTSSYPLDIVRRRMQTANLINPHESHLNPLELFKKVLRDEGFIKGLYKGLSMNWIKGPIAAGIGFMCYDVLQVAIRKSYCTFFLYENSYK
jgi:solute carrier family 25 protein 42